MSERGKLSTRSVQALRKPGRYGDGNGLYLQVGPSGTKAWLFRYKAGGRERFMGLGSPDLVSLAQARAKALEARRTLLDGTDPIAARIAARNAARISGGARRLLRAVRR